MPSGYQQRWQGKVLAQMFGVGAGGIQLASVSGAPVVSPSDLQTIDGQATVQALTTAASTDINGPGGVSSIASTSAISVWSLANVPSPGVQKTIALISVSSGVFIKAASGSSFDGSTNTVMKSTVAATITLMGLSTTKWSIKSVYPGSTLASSALTMSTTT